MKKCLLILTIALCCQSVYSQQTGPFYYTFDNNGIQSSVYMYVPEDYDSTKVYPLLWAWHGAGMPGEDMLDLMGQLRFKIKCIIVCPDANNVETNTQMGSLVNASYSNARRTYKLDTTKMIITGYSWGGGLSFQLGMRNPALVTGIIGLAPAVSEDMITDAMWNNVKKNRMAMILGSEDQNYSIVNSTMKKIRDKGGDILYIEKEGLDHGGTNGYYGTEEFLNDYVKCYNYIIGETNGVEDNQTVPDCESLTIFPNPAPEYIYLSAGPNIEASSVAMIYNSIGDCVMNINDTGSRIDISMLEPGVYSLIIVTGSKNQTAQFLVVK